MSGRIRSIKPEWLEDEAIISCSSEARVISIGLLLLADDHGNGRGSEVYLSSRIFPLAESLETLRNGLAELVKIRFVELYRLSGQTYFSIRNWKKHQRVDKPGKPRVPGPLDPGVEKIPGSLAKVPESLAPDPDPDPDPEHRIRTTTTTPFPASEKKIAKRTKTPSAPSADADGYTELVAIWFDCYERFYKRKPAWGAVYGRQLKAIMAKSDVEEMRVLIPAFFAWRRPEVIKGGHSLSTGYASLAMKLEELRADIAQPGRRAFAAVATDMERIEDQSAQSDAQTQRVLKSLEEKRNAIAGSGSSGSGKDFGGNIQPTPIRLGASAVGGAASGTPWPGTAAHFERRVQAAANAWPGRDSGDDHGSEEA